MKTTLKVKTRSQVAMDYGISRKTLYLWLKKAKISPSQRLLTPSDLRKIYKTYGNPNVEEVKETFE